MNSPIIGITCADNFDEGYSYCRETYYRAVADGGGVPLLLPSLPGLAVGYAGLIDGLLLSGGGDIDPVFFGESPRWELDETSPERDRFEIELLRATLALHKPVLGICRGIQLINVALGGTIYQDLRSQRPDTIQHRQNSPRSFPSHPVKVTGESRLAALLQTTSLRVNSLHHQAVWRLGKGLTATAWAPDGIIEGIEGELLMGVQWHPEALVNRQAHASALFKNWIELVQVNRSEIA